MSSRLKGVILAGGTGSRLWPLTKVTNKHLLPVGNKPMIYHPVEQLVTAGIEDILVITGLEHMGDVVNLLGSGADFGCNFTYKVQDQAGGIAQALSLAENFANGSPLAVILGDNVFKASLKPYAEKYLEQQKGARLLLKEVEHPKRFGVAEISDEKVTLITEKPTDPPSSYAVTGIYFYDAKVFDFIRDLPPSNRGELEISDVNNAYISQEELEYDILQDWWSDAGTFESYHRVNEWVVQEKKA